MAVRYQAVLKIRKYREDFLKEEVGRIIKGIEWEKNLLIAIEEEIDRSFNEMSSFQKGEVFILNLKEWNNYIIGLKERLKEQEERIAKLNEELDNARKRLIKASQERRIIEKLIEKNKIYEKISKEKKEIEELDEIGLSLFRQCLNVLSFKK